MDGLLVSPVPGGRIERSAGAEADVFEARIPNVGQRYTEQLRDTDGKRVDIKLAGAVRFAGFMDSADFDVVPGAMVTLAGRDYTGILIDETMSAALAKKLRGQTASGAVGIIAREYGLTASAEATTRRYGESRAFSDGVPVWEAVRDMAEREGFDAYVTAAKVLVFKKRAVAPSPSLVLFVPPEHGPFSTTGTLPVDLRFYQDKTLSLGLKVKAIGYDEKKKRRIVYTAESRLRNRPNYKLVEVVDYTLASKAEVRARAEAELTRISIGLVTGEATVAVADKLEPGQSVEVQNVPSFDGLYYVERVTHEWGPQQEFVTRVAFASKPLASARDMTVGEES